MKYLLIGGKGFIGKNLSKFLLDKNQTVTAVDIDTFDITKFDSKKVKIIEDHDIVVNLAGLKTNFGECNLKNYHDTNVTGLFNILNSLRFNKSIQLFHASSAAVTDKMSSTFYGFTKQVNEQYIKHFRENWGVNALALRFFNVYGDGDTSDSVINLFKNIRDKNKIIHLYNYGNNVRDFVHVDDVCESIYKLANLNLNWNKIPVDSIQIGTGEGTLIKDIANLIGKFKEYEPPRPGEIVTSIADTSDLYKLLKWKPDNKIIQWLNENLT